MPYFQVTPRDWWDGNMNSPTYNSHVRSATSPGAGSENLYDHGCGVQLRSQYREQSAAYSRQGVVAMFLHASNNQPTEGCVAIEEGAMRDILRWLDPAKNPKIVIGVNKGTPTDETANTLGTTLGSSEGNGFGDLVNFFLSLIPGLSGSSRKPQRKRNLPSGTAIVAPDGSFSLCQISVCGRRSPS